jgi:hypothetical protein
MRIRFTRAGYALAAGVATTALLGMSMGAASASPAVHKPPKSITMATTACSFHCVDVSFLTPGRRAILGVQSGWSWPNALVRLLQGSNGASKEDFKEIDLSTVAPLYCTITGQAQPGSVFTSSQCALMKNAGLLGRTTFQLAFNPNNGGPLTECVGAWGNFTPVLGGKLRLEPCGLSAATVLITTNHLPGGTTTGGGLWLINGGSNNFSNPVVATSNGTFPSQPVWSTVQINGGRGIDTQEVRGTNGPFF